MARIKIKDLQRDQKLTGEEIRSVLGGVGGDWRSRIAATRMLAGFDGSITGDSARALSGRR